MSLFDQLVEQWVVEDVEQKAALYKRMHARLLQLRLQQPDNSLLNENAYLEKLNHRLEKF